MTVEKMDIDIDSIIAHNKGAIGNLSTLCGNSGYGRLYDIFMDEIPLKDSQDFALKASFFQIELYSSEMLEQDVFERFKQDVRPLCLTWPSTGQIVADKSILAEGWPDQQTRYRWFIRPEAKEEIVRIALRYSIRINLGFSK